ncbi:hypothetical protein HPK19_03150 [Arthrobacter citreus]|nr:hypothetical protein HPK19_03150 [Arthrobacter citreus]
MKTLLIITSIFTSFTFSYKPYDPVKEVKQKPRFDITAIHKEQVRMDQVALQEKEVKSKQDIENQLQQCINKDMSKVDKSKYTEEEIKGIKSTIKTWCSKNIYDLNDPYDVKRKCIDDIERVEYAKLHKEGYSEEAEKKIWDKIRTECEKNNK